MAEQNILAGDVNVLDQMINDLNESKIVRMQSAQALTRQSQVTGKS